jgi:phage shock protein A
MPAQRIMELEQQLVTANAAVAQLTVSVTELTAQVADAELRNKKLRRNSKNSESSFKDQLAMAQNLRR